MRFLVFTCLSLLIISPVHGLTLKESIDLALKNNPSVISSQKKVNAAEARLSQAIGTFFPTVKLSGSYGRSYTEPYTVQITVQTTQGAVTQNYTLGTDAATDSKSLSTTLSQPLFVPALFPGLKIAQKSLDVTREDLRKTIFETSFSVTQAYFGVLKAEKLLKLSEESKEMAKLHLNQIKSMLGAGSATSADLLRAEVQLANSDVGLTRARNALEIARNAFNNALGRALEEEVKLSEEGFGGMLSALPKYQNLVQTAFNFRPDWKQYLLARQIAEENVRVAQTGYLPTVTLSGQTGSSITEYPTYKSDVSSWSITGAASWTLFDGLGIQNRIREAAANFEAQKAAEEQVKNGILLEVRDTYFNLKSASETIGSTKKALESAQENYKVSNVRFNSGIAANLEVIDAQVALTEARINYYQAQYDLEIAKAKINKVVGREIL